MSPPHHPPNLRLVSSAPPVDPLTIARTLGDKEMVSAILDERAAQPEPAPDLYAGLRDGSSAERKPRWHRLKDPSFVHGALFGFAAGQFGLLLAAIAIAWWVR